MQVSDSIAVIDPAATVAVAVVEEALVVAAVVVVVVAVVVAVVIETVGNSFTCTHLLALCIVSGDTFRIELRIKIRLSLEKIFWGDVHACLVVMHIVYTIITTEDSDNNNTQLNTHYKYIRIYISLHNHIPIYQPKLSPVQPFLICLLQQRLQSLVWQYLSDPQSN